MQPTLSGGQYHRVFLVHFHQFALVVVNLLPKPERRLLIVDFLQIARLPTHSTDNVQPITPSATRQVGPVPEFFLVLDPVAHFTSPARPIQYLMSTPAQMSSDRASRFSRTASRSSRIWRVRSA